jgi:hypothetical protein
VHCLISLSRGPDSRSGVLPKKKAKLSRYRHAGAKGKEKYTSYSFLTSTLDGGVWSASRPGRALLPGKGPLVPFGQEAGWASELVWTQRLE